MKYLLYQLKKIKNSFNLVRIPIVFCLIGFFAFVFLSLFNTNLEDISSKTVLQKVNAQVFSQNKIVYVSYAPNKTEIIKNRKGGFFKTPTVNQKNNKHNLANIAYFGDLNNNFNKKDFSQKIYLSEIFPNAP